MRRCATLLASGGMAAQRDFFVKIDFVLASGRVTFLRWAVAKLVRHQALDLAFEGSSPSRPANEGERLLPGAELNAGAVY